jgi:SAM-dependent methyltransferase
MMNDRAELYDERFFALMQSTARASAAHILPILIDAIAPASVVDVGCGTGTWLAAFKSRGIQDVLGMDGDWVDPSALEIPHTQFRVTDLTKSFSCDRTFDLAVSLEVAEHLPEESADDFVKSLVRLAPVVVFSAAVPFQGGRSHVNEQWPEYWATRFRQHGYLAVDFVRPRVWNNPDVSWWYAQNILVYCREDYAKTHEWSRDALTETWRSQSLAIIHPRRYEHAVRQLPDLSRMGMSALLAALPPAFARSVRGKLGRVFRHRDGVEDHGT